MTTFEKDFDALTVGESYVTRGRTIGEADITAFATLTGDTHPQHTDAEWAAGSRFGERIAHGLLVLSYASGLMPFDPERIVALRRVGDAVFKQPVRIGDTLHVEGEHHGQDASSTRATASSRHAGEWSTSASGWWRSPPSSSSGDVTACRAWKSRARTPNPS